MKQQYINKIMLSMNNKTLIPTISHAIRKRWPIWCISNEKIRALQLEDIAYKKLKKKYNYVIQQSPSEYILTGKNSKIIWTCWLQGLENAPLIVKKCYESLKKNMSDFDIKIIDEDNIFDYVEIPDYIVEKWNQGIISNAHFSDILRIELLVKYGGVWVDSTVLCTSNYLNNHITESSLFVYKSIMCGSNTISASSWLISSERNNPILMLVRELLYEYWKKEEIIIHYFLVHLFFTMSIEKYPEIWRQVPSFNNISPHILVDEFNNKFSEYRYEEIKNMSAFHKLNFKISYNENDDSFYSNIIMKSNF